MGLLRDLLRTDAHSAETRMNTEYGERGRNRIHNKTYFQQHAGPRMTHTTIKDNSGHTNRAHIERANPSAGPNWIFIEMKH